MLTLFFILFFATDAFLIDSNYWKNFNEKKTIFIYDVYNVEHAYGLKENVDYDAYFSDNDLSPDFYYSGEPNIPLWVVLTIHAFENWANVEGSSIDFEYIYVPGANEDACILDKDSIYNSVCWSATNYSFIGDTDFEDNLESNKIFYKARMLTINSDYDRDISEITTSLEEKAIKFCHIDDNTFIDPNSLYFCYDFLSYMNRAVGQFLGFKRLENTNSVMYYQIPENTHANTNTTYRVLTDLDKDAAKCLYPLEIEDRFYKEACCSNSIHIKRPPNLCDTRLNEDSRYSLGVGDIGGTCASINDNNSNSDKNIKYYLMYVLFVIFILFFRFLLRNKYLLIIIFFSSFNLFASFEYDLGFDDVDYKAIKESLKVEETKDEQKQFINTQDILEQEKIKKQELEEQNKTVEVKKVETLVQNLDQQLQYKKFRELKPFFSNINFGFTYSTVSDFKKINQDYKNADYTGFNDFNITYSTIIEFGIQNLLFQKFAPYIAVGYQFNTKDTATYYIETNSNKIAISTYSNTFSAIPIKLGAKYNFYNTESIVSGINVSGGFWVASSSIILEKESSSKLSMSGLGYTTNMLIFMDFLVVNKIYFTFNLGYEYSRSNKVVIDSSTGDFEVQFPKNSILQLKDEETGSSRPFRYFISGAHIGAGIKGLF